MLEEAPSEAWRTPTMTTIGENRVLPLVPAVVTRVADMTAATMTVDTLRPPVPLQEMITTAITEILDHQEVQAVTEAVLPGNHGEDPRLHLQVVGQDLLVLATNLRTHH